MSHEYKESKNAPLGADLPRTLKVFHFSVEVTARGLITKGEQGSFQIFRGEMRGRREFGSEAIYLLLL